MSNTPPPLDIEPKKLDASAYKHFLFTFEPIKNEAGKAYEDTPALIEMQSNVKTNRIIMPKDRLAEQGELLWNYINHPEKRPPESEIPQVNLENALFDAAFKVQTVNGTALHWAIEKDQTDIALKLINNATVDQLLMVDSEGETAAHFAAAKNNVKVTEALLTRLTPDQFLMPDKTLGDTPIHTAVTHNAGQVFNVLAQNEKTRDKLFTPNHVGESFLHLDASANRPMRLPLLKIQTTKEASTPDANGDTFLHVALANGNFTIVQDFVSPPKSTSHRNLSAYIAPNNSGNTIVHLAAMNGGPDFFTKIVENPSIPTEVYFQKNMDNKTPLDIILKRDWTPFVASYDIASFKMLAERSKIDYETYSNQHFTNQLMGPIVARATEEQLIPYKDKPLVRERLAKFEEQRQAEKLAAEQQRLSSVLDLFSGAKPTDPPAEVNDKDKQVG